MRLFVIATLFSALLSGCNGSPRHAKPADAPRDARPVEPTPADAAPSGAQMTTTTPELDEHLHLLSSEHPGDIQRGVAVVNLVQSGGRFDNATYAAVRILGEMHRPEDVALLKSVLHAGKGTLSMEAAKALGAHQTPEAERALIDTLTAKDRDVVQSALVSLGMHPTQTARMPSRPSSTTPSRQSGTPPVHALGTMGAAPSLPALRKRRSVERDPEVKAELDQLLRPR